jgi:predicted pyridoxine 5'-phosphate oxidase superfamily flavin-nucleotide-binding protein
VGAVTFPPPRVRAVGAVTFPPPRVRAVGAVTFHIRRLRAVVARRHFPHRGSVTWDVRQASSRVQHGRPGWRRTLCAAGSRQGNRRSQVPENAMSCEQRASGRGGEGQAMTVMDIAVRAFMPARRRNGHRRQPGSAGERILQERYGTAQRAEQFYKNQVTGTLTPVMRQFIQRMEMAFIATSDSSGECDCSFRAGPAGFIKVLDDHTIAYPEYRGNGVMASLGNMLQNPHVGIFLVDFTQDLIGLHVNGHASLITPARMREFDLDLPESVHPGRRPVQWVLVQVTEAYVHCSKHVPKLVPQSRVRHWGTDNPRHKGGDYFGVAASKAATVQSASLQARVSCHPAGG